MAVELISDFALIADRLPTRDSEAVLRTLDAALLAAGPIGAGAASGARATYSFLDTAPLSAHRRACRVPVAHRSHARHDLYITSSFRLLRLGLLSSRRWLRIKMRRDRKCGGAAGRVIWLAVAAAHDLCRHFESLFAFTIDLEVRHLWVLKNSGSAGGAP